MPPPPTYVWTEGESGDWGTASDWSGGVVPDGTSNATIAGTGTETVTVSGNQATNILTLDNANATLAVTNGATLSAYGGLVASAVHEVDVTSGTLLVGGGSQTLDNATINLGDIGFGSSGALTTDTASQQSAVLTLGPNLTVNAAHGGIQSGNSVGSGIVNQGTINAIGDVGFGGYAVTNQGVIDGSNANINVQTFTNDNGATASLTLTDAAGNTANGTGDTTVKDTTADTGPTATVTINDGDGSISNAEKSAVTYTISGRWPGVAAH